MKNKLLIFTSNYSLFQIGFEMINLYGVVYFYQSFDNSIVIALGSIILLQLGYLSTLLVIVNLLGRLGTRVSMMIGSILFFFSFFPLVKLETDKDIVWIVCWILISMFAKAFHHLPFYYYVSIFTDSKSRGAEMGIVNAISVFFEALAPILGGFTLQRYGISSLAMVSLVIFGLSIIPLFFLDNYHFKPSTSIRKIMKLHSAKQLVRLHVVNELQANSNIAWYIYVFILIGANFTKLGTIFTIVIIISAIISYSVGKFLDHHNRRKIMHMEGFISALAWLLRAITTTFGMVIITDTIFKVNRYIKDELVDVLNLDLLTHEGHSEIIDDVILLRQVAVNIAIILSLSVSLLLVYYFGFEVAFFFSAFASLFFLIV
ncbi:MFS transporter [Candidatus Dojkabacteria bacterium]|uniref:MFS transporter n=1 Tax=Candidatus Dojkabacteria bacterium TaxID=2099670 RepID=A0A955L4M1_9BACT|nr:MFS transporter [Candidatus Dojkabacteria bacterium]